ncbi:hypothetical protein ACK2SD_19635 [Pseudomonas sp. SC11]|uniref:hypothetical protein n=1 Tax=Pseudomonas sp. SC11 TaxID=326927 RepID=UPI00399B61F8
MSDRPSLDQGGTAVGERVNPVRLHAPQLDQNDKTVLCSAVCHCSAAPAISRDGRNLKQVCVAQPLQARGQLRHDQAATAADSRQPDGATSPWLDSGMDS